MQIEPPPFEPLVGEAEAIRMLGLQGHRNPRGALQWLRRSGKLAFVRLTRTVISYKPADLRRLIEAGYQRAGRAQ